MLKQYIAIILLSIFNFILVGHSIIPHEHDEVDHHAHSNNHHHRSDQHSDQPKEENSKKESSRLSDFFSLVIHVSEFVRSENRISGSEKTIQKEESEIAAFSFLQTTSFIAKDLKSEGINYRDPDYYPPPNSHKGLRAPPLFFS